MCRYFGDEVSIELGSDSSAAKGVLGRLGLGKIRHLETGLLWISSVIDCQAFKSSSLGAIRTRNSGDIGTKYLSEADMRRYVTMAGVVDLSSSQPFARGIGQIACRS